MVFPIVHLNIVVSLLVSSKRTVSTIWKLPRCPCTKTWTTETSYCLMSQEQNKHKWNKKSVYLTTTFQLWQQQRGSSKKREYQNSCHMNKSFMMSRRYLRFPLCLIFFKGSIVHKKTKLKNLTKVLWERNLGGNDWKKVWWRLELILTMLIQEPPWRTWIYDEESLGL